MSKPKFPPEIKIHACEDFLSGKYTSAQVCEKYGITYNEKNCSSTSLSEWVAKYRAVGPEAFTHFHHNKSYSLELKKQAVEEYLSLKGTILEITVKYGISDTKVFRRWILKYRRKTQSSTRLQRTSGSKHIRPNGAHDFDWHLYREITFQ